VAVAAPAPAPLSAWVRLAMLLGSRLPTPLPPPWPRRLASSPRPLLVPPPSALVSASASEPLLLVLLPRPSAFARDAERLEVSAPRVPVRLSVVVPSFDAASRRSANWRLLAAVAAVDCCDEVDEVDEVEGDEKPCWISAMRDWTSVIASRDIPD